MKKSFRGTSRMGVILFSLCEIIIGILLLVNPTGFTRGIIVFLGIALMLAGIASIVRYFRTAPEVAMLEQHLSMGCIELLAGAFCVFNSGWFLRVFPLLTVLYGVLVLVAGIAKVQWTIDKLRMKMKPWIWSAVSAAITLICAVVILCNPFTSTAVVWMFIAISLIVEAVIDIVSAVFTKEGA